jgi:catechol 2,3-dioxygenase-like lactoylglutathione lyase family enzyme
MQLINVRLMVADVPAAMRFWREVMQLPMTYADESIGYAYFEAGGAGVELFTHDGLAAALGEPVPAPAPAGRQALLVFKVDDVNAAYAELVARGAVGRDAPRDMPAWGARTAHVAGPENLLVEIYSPLSKDGAAA